MVSEQATDLGSDMNDALAALLDELDETALATERRDSAIPEREVLAEAEGEHLGITRSKKQSSLVTFGGKSIADRFPVYDRTNRIRMVPTVMMMQMLAKSAFRSVSKGPWPDVPKYEHIEATCQFCNKVRRENGNSIPRRFYDETQVEPHMRAFHEGQWTALLRVQEQEARAEDSKLNRQMLDAMMDLLKQGRTTDVREVLDNTGILVEEIKGLNTCPDCGKVDLKGKQGLAMHKRRWCKG